MKAKRLLQTISLCMKRGALARGDYLRKKDVFASCGENVAFQPRKVPLYPKLIKLHNNIMIGANVQFITHDAIEFILSYMDKKEYPEHVGCIEVKDNVFIGANTSVLYGVQIGENVIIGANSLVNKDVEPNSVYAGIPARKVGDFAEFKKKNYESMDYICAKENQDITPEEIRVAWNDFNEKHK